MTGRKSRKRLAWTIAAAALDLVLAAGTVLSVYYCNYLAPVQFTTPPSLNAHRDLQPLLPGLGTLRTDGLVLDGGTVSSPDAAQMDPVTIPGAPEDLSGKFADKFSSKTTATASTYQSKDLAVTVTQHSFGTGKDKVTYPAFFMSFQPDGRKLRGSFLPTALRRALPNALAIAVCFLAMLPLPSWTALPPSSPPSFTCWWGRWAFRRCSKPAGPWTACGRSFAPP